MSDGTVSTKLLNPAVTEVLLKQILALKAAGKSEQEIISILRADTVPSGYKIHPWITGIPEQHASISDTNMILLKGKKESTPNMLRSNTRIVLDITMMLRECHFEQMHMSLKSTQRQGVDFVRERMKPMYSR